MAEAIGGRGENGKIENGAFSLFFTSGEE